MNNTGSCVENIISTVHDFFLEQIEENQAVYVCISGGSDSMLVMRLLDLFYVKHGWNKEMVTILHYDHKQRDGVKEKEMITNTYSDYVLVFGEYTGNESTEGALRTARWNFIGSVVQQNEKENIIITGHNLTDRIETTFLNMCRGSHKKGLINMRHSEVGGFFRKIIGKNCRILRPLLGFDKASLRTVCHELHIPYIEDPTNSDNSFSKRNVIRNTIIPAFLGLSSSGSEKFFESFRILYGLLESTESKQNFSWQVLTPSLHWKSSFYAIFPIPQSLQDIVSLFDALGIYKNISHSCISDVYTFLRNANSGRKNKDEYYFLKSHGKCYVCKSGFEFWRREISIEKSIITTGVYTCGDFIRNIKDESIVGGVLRFPKRGDKWGRTSLARYFSKQKLPFFWRKHVPLIEKNGLIVAIYHFEDKRGVLY